MKDNTLIPTETKSLWTPLGFGIALFFLVVTAAIAGTWLSNAIKYINGHAESYDIFSLAFATLIIVPVSGVALVSLLACTAILFGKKDIYHGTAASMLGVASGVNPAQVDITSLLGIELVRESSSRSEDIPLQPFPPIPIDVPWSDIAFDNYNMPGATSATTDIFEATLWHLIAKGCVTLSLRYEAKTFFSKWRSKKVLKPYCTFRKGLQEGSAYWEQKFLTSIQAKPQPLSVYDWIVDAYGDTAANVHRKITKAIEKEYVEAGMGKTTGMFGTGFEYNDRMQMVRNAQHWQEIRLYAATHGSGDLIPAPAIRSAIEKALKNRESSD